MDGGRLSGRFAGVVGVAGVAGGALGGTERRTLVRLVPLGLERGRGGVAGGRFDLAVEASLIEPVDVGEGEYSSLVTFRASTGRRRIAWRPILSSCPPAGGLSASERISTPWTTRSQSLARGA